MNTRDEIRIYDLDAAERRKIEDAEARFRAYETHLMLGEIQNTLNTIDNLLVSLAGRLKTQTQPNEERD